MSRVVALALALSLAGGPQAPPSAPEDRALADGIALVKEGDFEAALIQLDSVVRTLQGRAGRGHDLARANAYLGVAYLELEQEAAARARFRDALAAEPDLRLSPREFSAQTIRIFEGVRGEIGPRPSPTPSPTAAVRTPASPAPEKKKKSPLIFILGGGAAAAGVAVAVAGASGGGKGGGAATTTTTPGAGGTTTTPSTIAPSPSPTEPAPTTTTTTTTTPSSTTTTTTTTPSSTTTTTTSTTTTTTTMPACAPSISGSVVVPQLGGNGNQACSVTAAGGCAWTAVRSETWFTISPQTGSGAGGITVNGSANLGSSRSGAVTLAGGSGQCQVSQSGLVGVTSTDVAVSVALEAPKGTAQVVLDGAQVLTEPSGRLTVGRQREAAGHRVEGWIVSAGGPGAWRFAILGAVRPGSLRVVSGRVASITPDTIVFAVSGRPGERVLFVFDALE
jgi:hypothetical protein